jgi:hypothetical protein
MIPPAAFPTVATPTSAAAVTNKLPPNVRPARAPVAAPPTPYAAAVFQLTFPFEISCEIAEPKNLTLDTGSISTDLNPPFAAAFPDLMKTGQKHSDNITGVGGSNSYDSILLPSATLQIGGYDVTLKPAHVFTTHGLGWSAGNLGIDLLNQGYSITLDFHAMTLELR